MTEEINNLGKVWIKFFNKLNATPGKIWDNYNLLGYFLKRFKEQYEFDYSLSMKSPPSNTTELVIIKKLYAALNTNNANLIKEYIDWCFDKKIKPKKYKIKNITYFLATDLVNEFKYYNKEKNKITKSKELPREYIELIEEFNLPVKTYGDLQFVKALNETEPNNEVYKKVLSKLYSLGFDDKMIEGI